MTLPPSRSDEQATLWNGIAGQAWVEQQATLDQILKPFEDLLVEAVAARSASQVLDVGCGTGSTTLAVARLLGAQGRCTGIDISEPMLAAARVRAEDEGIAANFICADAQAHAFEPASFDMIMSRFGVMFFDDSVQAFANLRRAARAHAELRFVAWRCAEDNPFMTTAERAAAAYLPNLPARVPNAPGPLALADQRRLQRMLEESGWIGIDIQPVDVACAFPERELIRYLTGIGPLGRALHQVNDPTRSRIIETVRAAFDPYVHGVEVRFNAACWMVVAHAPSSTTPATPHA
ncbi:class I SAM-dependent methyltransferase [Dyella silvatica]|uniref:class I SAM-dependent methyltransferase n=1 Tax=Dyella silvatica TaxID=2992128 RepID=UPI0022548288|nr:class I SAM-dependent methyltransferase [Dyella silvatica]